MNFHNFDSFKTDAKLKKITMNKKLKLVIQYLTVMLAQIKFRRIVIPNVSEIILSEDSSVHWKNLDVTGKRVLDLGCGLWGVSDMKESSPVYFKNKGATQIIGIDSNNEDLETFNKYFKEHFLDQSQFLCKMITTPNDVLELIQKYEIEAIKCDIEGFEKVLFKLEKGQLERVQHISVEYHNHALMLEMLYTLNRWGFHVTKHSLFGYGNFYLGVLTATRSQLD